MSQTCQIRKRFSFSAVPDVLFEMEMSHTAFKVVAWALGRPDGWIFHIEHMIKTLGLTDKTWPRAKKELLAAGFFIQKKGRDERNKITWENIFVDNPLWSENSIPPKSRDGIGSDAKGTDAPGGDIAEDVSIVSKRAAAALFKSCSTPTNSKVKVGGTEYFSSPEFGNMVLQKGNDRDLKKAAELVEAFSIDQINKAIFELEDEDKLGFPSNVVKKLGFKKSQKPEPTVNLDGLREFAKRSFIVEKGLTARVLKTLDLEFIDEKGNIKNFFSPTEALGYVHFMQTGKWQLILEHQQH